MATRAALYLIAHQPRRLRLPAVPIPAGMSPAGVEAALFDDEMNRRYFERVLVKSYEPTVDLLGRLAGSGVAVNLALTESLRWQAERWAPEWLARWDQLAAMDPVETVAVDPYHGFLFYVDPPAFVRTMRASQAAWGDRTGRRPHVADTTEMWLSPAVSAALADAGYVAEIADGRPGLLDWRRPTYLYRTGPGQRLYVVPRHVDLSDDVGYRYSDKTWSGWPLKVETYSRWIAEAEGAFVFLGWDFETFGEHHWADTGIFAFLEALPEALQREGVTLYRLSDLIRELGPTAHELPMGLDAVTWAGQGSPDFFLGNEPQRLLFRWMHEVWALARRRGGPAMELATWLLQSDHLHLLHWYGASGSEAEVSAYFTPQEWWSLGGAGIVREMTSVYREFARWCADAP
jgi:alpha-amylase